MAFGPIDIIVLEFKGCDFEDEVIVTLTDLVSNEIIRILDFLIVRRDELGEVNVQELNELDPAIKKLLEPLKAEISGMITAGDIRMIGNKLKENTTAAIMLFENIWAVKIQQDISYAGGRFILHERIPKEVVTEAIKELAEFD